jgi:mannosyltransferase OCH1-like enzyme
MKIPKIIHQIWFQGEDNIPPNLLEHHNTWIKINPDYEIIVWDQIKIENLVNKQDKWIKETYFFYSKMIQKIDFAKYVILYNYGGIYMDMDIKCIQSLNNTPNITDSDIILSYMETLLFQKIIISCLLQKYIMDDYINNGTIMCVPKTELMLLTMKEASQRKNLPDFFNVFHVYYTTGPLCLTIAYHKMIKNTNKTHILNKSYFENCDIFDFKNNTCEIPTNAIGIHYYANGWTSKKEKFGTSLISLIIKYWYILLIILIIFIIVLFNHKQLFIKKPSLKYKTIKPRK